MERRWSHRVPLKAKIVVYHQGLPVLISESQNISREGLLIEAKSSMLPTQGMVEIEFTLTDEGRTESHRLPAVIVHRQNGIGLMFSPSDTEAIDAVNQFFYKTRD